MSIHKLSSGSEAIIAMMQLTHEEEDVVRNCVSKYAKPEDFSQMFTWIFNRIANAVKRIFGSSDWQITLGVIQKRAMHEIETKAPQMRKTLQFREQDIAKIYADELLDRVFSAHNEKKESSFEFQQMIKLQMSKLLGLAD